MDGWLSCYGVFFAGIVGLTFDMAFLSRAMGMMMTFGLM